MSPSEAWEGGLAGAVGTGVPASAVLAAAAPTLVGKLLGKGCAGADLGDTGLGSLTGAGALGGRGSTAGFGTTAPDLKVATAGRPLGRTGGALGGGGAPSCP